MSYLSIEEYSRKWIFNHSSMPVPKEVQKLLKPMTQSRSAQFWKDNISSTSPDADRLASGDWPMNESNWLDYVDWMEEWESDLEVLPQQIIEHIDWQDDVTVYFCYEKYNIIETKWCVFRQYWKNFLFYDDGPILLGRRRKEALWFQNSGKVKIGVKG